MKRIFCILLVLCLAAALIAGCSKPAPEAAPEATAAPEENVPEPPAPELPADATDIVRLESIDLGSDGKLMLSLTEGTCTPVAGDEGVDDYELKFAGTVKHPLKADARIDFPMVDDLAATVSIVPDELTSEFQAFVEAFEDKPLFTMTLDGDEIATLTYFYLP